MKLTTLHVTLALLVLGMALIGAALWAWLGWPGAALFWGACLMAAGISEVVG